MTLSQVCGIVVANSSMKLIQPRKTQDESGLIEYDVKDYEGNKRGWVLLDSFTANAMTSVYNAINETQRAKLDSMPALKAINLCWKLIK